MKIDELGWNSLPWGGIHNNIIQRLITNYCHCHGQGHQAHTCMLHLCTLTMLVSLGSIMLISWNEFWCSSSADVWCWIMLVSVGELEIKCIYLESKAENSIGNSTIKCHYLIPESSSSSSSVLDTSSLSNILNSSILTTLTVFLPLFYSIYSEGFWGWCIMIWHSAVSISVSSSYAIYSRLFEAADNSYIYVKCCCLSIVTKFVVLFVYCDQIWKLLAC